MDEDEVEKRHVLAQFARVQAALDKIGQPIEWLAKITKVDERTAYGWLYNGVNPKTANLKAMRKLKFPASHVFPQGLVLRYKDELFTEAL